MVSSRDIIVGYLLKNNKLLLLIVFTLFSHISETVNHLMSIACRNVV